MVTPGNWNTPVDNILQTAWRLLECGLANTTDLMGQQVPAYKGPSTTLSWCYHGAAPMGMNITLVKNY